MTPYFSLNIEDDLNLVYPELGMAKEIFELLDSDRDHLRVFLDFVDDSKDEKNQEDYIKMKMQGAANGTDKLFFIAKGDRLIGCIDLHFIHSASKKADISYWLHSDYTKQGIVSKSVRKLCEYAFVTLGLNKLTILADTENSGSNAVALSCGFSFLGTRKQDKQLYGKYRDINEYYLLKSDFSS